MIKSKGGFFMKRKLAWAMCLCMMVSLLCGTAAAAPAAPEEEILPVLAVMGILNGDEQGNMDLDRAVTRAEFVKMAVSASACKEQGQAVAGISPYPDVRAGAWHSGYIAAARDAGWITGYLDGTFRPDNTVTLEEAVSIMLKVMGYSGSDFAAGFPAAHMSLYRSLGLDSGMTAAQGSRMTRRDCAVLVYNCLNAKAKSGAVYAVQLGYKLDNSGRIDYAALTTALTEGPVLLESSVEAAVGFTPVAVNRDRHTASAAQLQTGDVLYYNKDIRTVWAYSGKVSGVVQAISPSTAAPTSVTVSGMTCVLGSASVIYHFSELGTIHVGDSVTLLLGAGEQAVFVQTGIAASDTLCGIVTAVGTQTQSGALGTISQQKTVTVAADDGSVRTYPYEKDSLKVGDVVRVTVDAAGVTIVKAGSGDSLSGTVKNGSLGGYRLDENSRILDYLSGRAVAVTAARLEGVRIGAGDVLYAETGDGHVDRLILKNVTGDTLDYGVAVTAFESPDIMHVSSTYVVMVNGVPRTHSAQATYGVDVGPCGVQYKADGNIDRLVSLRSGTVERLGAFAATLKNGESLPLAAGLQVYIKDGDNWYLSNRLDLPEEEYKLTAWYDDTAQNGGCVRVLVAEK